jgi:hypothetical protein
MLFADMTLLAQRDAGAILMSMVCVVIVLLIPAVVMIIAGWKIFEKAGEPGWAAIVPIYNAMVYCRIAGKPEWWVLLFLIPCVGIVFAIITTIAFAEKFGKSGAFAVGLILLGPIFYPILAFGGAEYEGSRRKRPRRREREYDDEAEEFESRKSRRRREDEERGRRQDDYEDDRPRRRRPRDDDDE